MQLWQSEYWLSVLAGLVLMSLSGCASSTGQQNGTASLLQEKVEVGTQVHALKGEMASVAAENEELDKQLDNRDREAIRFGRHNDQMARLRWRLMEAQATPLVRF